MEGNLPGSTGQGSLSKNAHDRGKSNLLVDINLS